jgi:hypothetical protein
MYGSNYYFIFRIYTFVEKGTEKTTYPDIDNFKSGTHYQIHVDCTILEEDIKIKYRNEKDLDKMIENMKEHLFYHIKKKALKEMPEELK